MPWSKHRKQQQCTDLYSFVDRQPFSFSNNPYNENCQFWQVWCNLGVDHYDYIIIHMYERWTLQQFWSNYWITLTTHNTTLFSLLGNLLSVLNWNISYTHTHTLSLLNLKFNHGQQNCHESIKWKTNIKAVQSPELAETHQLFSIYCD